LPVESFANSFSSLDLRKVTQSIFAEAAQFGALMQTQKNPGVAVGGWVISKSGGYVAVQNGITLEFT